MTKLWRMPFDFVVILEVGLSSRRHISVSTKSRVRPSHNLLRVDQMEDDGFSLSEQKTALSNIVEAVEQKQ